LLDGVSGLKRTGKGRRFPVDGLGELQ
jgi:hypothetical protein